MLARSAEGAAFVNTGGGAAGARSVEGPASVASVSTGRAAAKLVQAMWRQQHLPTWATQHVHVQGVRGERHLWTRAAAGAQPMQGV